MKLGPADYRSMPWKNGLGTTTELLIHPPGATLEGGFLWRLSMAAVPESGPFSRFPGIDRSLMLLEGDGLDLDHGPHGRSLLAGPYQPACFSGDWDTTGRLLGGPCRDFNVMSARDRVRHRLQVLRPGPGLEPLPVADATVVVCLEGRAEVAGLVLEPLETLVLDRAAAVRAPEAAVLALVGFDYRSSSSR